MDEDRYLRYLACSNERRFGGLDEFVRPDVRVNGEEVGLGRYADGLAGVVSCFPTSAGTSSTCWCRARG